MSEKTKHKHDSPSLWTFPKPFRYEVKGDSQHVIQALETLALKRTDSAYTCDVQISSDALEEETTFTIDRYLQSPKWKSDPHRDAQLHGRICSTQAGQNVIEGHAFMGDSKSSVLWRWLLCGIILLAGFTASAYTGDKFVFIFVFVIATFPLMSVYTDKLSRDDLLEDLLLALQTYPIPLDKDPLNLASDLQSPSQAPHQ